MNQPTHVVSVALTAAALATSSASASAEDADVQRRGGCAHTTFRARDSRSDEVCHPSLAC